ncbi:hypothetical protein NDU88_006219 [Pleurodeles waltl]|uniref:Uncharacterized protein n=1 Tax=Pleurodeles waltl TaxID=8319 RepID=A0AAV7WE28_PLEWA|nr:hypothetical protein NDU88_006219 [Pleurodeles waltl]
MPPEGSYCPLRRAAMGTTSSPSPGAPLTFLGSPRTAGLKVPDPHSCSPLSGATRAGSNHRRAPPPHLTAPPGLPASSRGPDQ